jgi:hypothetical protein
MAAKRKLSEILSEAQREAYFADWNKVKAAGDFIIPKGEYTALWIDGYAHKVKTGTDGFKLIFEILDGEHAGRKLYHDLWLTEAAKPQTKRDLDALGITDPERQLDGPTPQGIVVSLTVVVRKDDDGIEQNRIRRIKFLGVEPADAFAPPDADGVDTSFDPAALEGPKDTPGHNGASLHSQQRNDGPYGREGERR